LIKTPVAIQPAYTIYFERFADRTWTHADVHKWTPTIKKEFMKVHGLLQTMHSEPFYCLTDNNKLEKFVKSIGYSYVQTLPCDDGIPRPMWRYVNG
tara:strand:+ start:404 stop:691 length:288 start_codon:yes stop_codon:yes gene_type:complete